jgi:YVTN family beta-propeller protein
MSGGFARAAVALLSIALTATAADGASLRFLRRIKVGLWPKAIAVSPDGERAFVALHHGGELAVIERKSLKVAARADLGGRPEALAVSPDGKRVYLTVGDQGTVQVRDGATLALTGTLSVGARPRGIALSPDGAWMFVAAGKEGKLVVATTVDLALRGAVELGWAPRAVAYDATRGQVLVAHTTGQSLYVVDPRQGQVLHRLRGFGRRPLDVAIAPGGAEAFVPSSKRNRVYRVTLAPAPRIEGAIPVGEGPMAAVLAPSGKTLFAALWGEDRIAVVRLPGRGRPRKVRSGKGPIALALSPSGKTLWAACFKSHEVWVYAVR